MSKDERGYWIATVEQVLPGTLYFYSLEEKYGKPDPASHFQPQGVNGPSQVINHSSFQWGDEQWSGILTPEGTFEAIIPRLDDLQDLGINAIEIMPVTQFSGERNWGYDGVYPFAVHYSYGGPEGLKKVEEFSNQQERKFCLIAESDLNDLRITQPKERGGYGIDAQWCDDFHHSIHTILTNENVGSYIDFGNITHLVKTVREGFVYSWHYSLDRKRRYMISSKDIPAQQFVVFSQNHDQIGNRIFGERLSKLVSFETLKLAAGMVLLSPYIPLLFMGEEYGEESPFLYFVNHSNPDIIAGIREGRKRKFKAFRWIGEPPDPQSLETFLQSKLKWEKRTKGKHKVLLEFYRLLIQFRKDLPAIKNLDKKSLDVFAMEEEKLIFIRRWHEQSQGISVMNFNTKDVSFRSCFPYGRWGKVMDSSDKKWMGAGPLLPLKIEQEEELTIRPLSFALYEGQI